jgi:hypothetical protein
MTRAILIASSGWRLRVNDADDHVADRAFRVADHVARGLAVGGDQHMVVQTGAVRVNGHGGRARGVALGVERLADEELPPFQALVLAGGGDVPIDAGVDHQ